MRCTKTGAQAYLQEYGEYISGDARMIDNVLIFRYNVRSREKIRTDTHFTIFHVNGCFIDGSIGTIISNDFVQLIRD